MPRRGRKKAPTPTAKSSIAMPDRQAVVPRGDLVSSSRSAVLSAWELATLALIIGTAVFLRFGRWDLIEFKGDETIALQLALGFVKGGPLPMVGLMSSVGVSNPPLFIYLLSPIVALSTDPAFVTSIIAATDLAAVVVCWHVGRKYYGAAVGLVAAALFAVSPWAIIFSRKIWAQDFVPIFAALTLWAVHALVSGRNRRAIFWVVLLPLCVIQIHFSGFALTAAIGCILLLLRPNFDWRFAVGGAAAAMLLFTPYLYYQTENDWADFSRAAATLGGNPLFNPADLLIDPYSGYPLPNHHYLTQALGVVNGGEIEDLIGLSKPKFEESLTFENWALGFQQFVCVAGVIYLVVLAVRGIRWSQRFPWAVLEQDEAKTAWILACWLIVPMMVYVGAGLATVMSYFVLYYPAPYLICAVVWRKLWMKAGGAVFARALLCGALGFILAGNLCFILNLYGVIARDGGAHGSYGTILGDKRQAAANLAETLDVGQLLAEKRLVQMDQFGLIGPPQPDIPFLASQSKLGSVNSILPPNITVVIVDRNRAGFTPEQWTRLSGISRREFGPIQFYFVPQGGK